MSKYGENFVRLGRGIYLTCEKNPKMLHFEHGGLFVPPLYIDNCLDCECDADFQAVLDKWYNGDGSPNEEYISARVQESYEALRLQESNQGHKAGKRRVCQTHKGPRKVFRKFQKRQDRW